MRSISLVYKIEVDYKGTLFKNAVCLVDIDNDDLNELCVGFTNGELHVYKGKQTSKPWRISKDLGSLVVLCGGRVQSSDEVVLCALTGEGRCRLFDVPQVELDEKSQSEYGSSVSSRPSSPSNELRLIHQEMLHPNAKVAILEDIDNDGICELIVGFTDRFVRIYKWQVEDCRHCEADDTILQSQFNSTKNYKGGGIETDKKSMLSFSLSLSKEPKFKEFGTTPSVIPKMSTTPSAHHKISSTPSVKILHQDAHVLDTISRGGDQMDGGKRYPSSSCHAVGKFVLLQQFSLLGQIGSIAVCKTEDGLNQLIVSQPNGGYCILGQYDEESGFTETVSTPTSIESPTLTSQQESYPMFYPISSNIRISHHINTEIVGGIKRQNNLTGVIGLCTDDGNFIILDNTFPNGMYPVKTRSQNNWFAMSKLDVTANGDDEIVLCSMDGMTYIIDKERDIVSFNFNENVAAFCTGYYGIDDKNSQSICYVTLAGKIHLYYNVWIEAMKVKCVHTALIRKIKSRPELHYLLDLFKLPNGDIDHQKLQNLLKTITTRTDK